MARQKKMIYIADTSVLIKWFKQEKDTEKALKFREDYTEGEIEIAIPDLAFYELANVLRYDDSFDEEMIEESLETVRQMDFQVIAPFKEFTDQIVNSSEKFNITAYDSAFYSLAKMLDGKLITGDEKLVNKIEDERTVLLEDYTNSQE